MDWAKLNETIDPGWHEIDNPILYNDVMTEDGLTPMTNEEIEKIVDKFNSIGCTSFMLTPEQVKQSIEQYEKENSYGKGSNSNKTG